MHEGQPGPAIDRFQGKGCGGEVSRDPPIVGTAPGLDDLGVGRVRTFKDVIVPLAAPGIFAGSVFIFVNGLGVALVPTILGGPGAVNAGLIVNQAIVALDFPLAMATSAIVIFTLVILLYIGHRLFDLTKILQPIS